MENPTHNKMNMTVLGNGNSGKMKKITWMLKQTMFNILIYLQPISRRISEILLKKVD